MIKEKNAKAYCSDDISLIENYNEAINSSEVWICHHRLGIDLGKGRDELIDMGLYFDRPASELQFLSRSEHIRLHNLYMSEERKDKIISNSSTESKFGYFLFEKKTKTFERVSSIFDIIRQSTKSSLYLRK